MTKQCYFCNKAIELDSLYCTFCGNKDITKDEIADIEIYLKRNEKAKGKEEK
tara:strand:- start:854 stop:1009 length:156 start_codon:yes stop_codon:yes gene_type:complete